MNNLKFNNYKKLKSQFTFKYKGFDMEHILAISIWSWANRKTISLSHYKCFFRSIDVVFLENIDSDYVLFSDEPRKDHNTTFNQIADKIKDKYEIINKSKEIKSPFCLSVANIIKSIILVFRHIKGLNIIKKIGIAGYLCMYVNTIDNILLLNVRIPKKLVVFSAVHEKQNLLVQYFRMKGSYVIGLTHGTQFVYSKDIPIDCLNYENLDVDCLVWSQMTKDEYVKYGIDEDKIFIAGYPKKYQLRELSSLNNMRKCIVLLSRKTYDESNMNLLKLLSKFTKEYDFFLKLHPSCNYNTYNEISKRMGFKIIPQEVLLTDCMDNKKFDFAIAVNTTSYYEILIAGIPCLRYKDGDVYDLMPGHPNDCVSTEEDFKKSLAWLDGNQKYEQIRNKLLEYNLGIGIDKYRDILLS